MSGTLDYRAAGVDLAAAEAAKARIRVLVESTATPGTLGSVGGFAGMFRAPEGARRPVLVASADGVGTKLQVAIEAGRHDTVGQDLVNHCVNDILTCGAAPLFFLDYIAFGQLVPDVAEALVRGVAAGCRENGCALIGGETAEMPGLYTPPAYDLAGSIVGWVEEDEALGAERVCDGDVLIGLESAGLHTNGYSLARQIIRGRLGLHVHDRFPGAEQSVADILLRVHRSYLAALRPVLGRVHAVAHITGGGLPGNLHRVLPRTLDAVVEDGSWPVPHEFRVLASAGNVSRAEMLRVFNMGVGMVVVASFDAADAITASARSVGVEAWVIGHTAPGSGRVTITPE